MEAERESLLYSIDAQLRANRDHAERQGWTVVREFVVAESAKRGIERQVFNEMYKWVKSNAKREGINAVLSHKLDRVCRNIRDAVRMQELEDQCGVRLAFVENHFGPGAAGALSFNIMAAVAQYYSDNLRTEVLKGLDEKVRQGWPTGTAPFGYINTDDRETPVKPHPENFRAVQRIFELYALGDQTFKSLGNQLEREGFIFRNCEPRFNRTTLSYILNNRFYIGELRRNGQVFGGKYERLIDRATFELCQEVLKGKNHRMSKTALPFSGGLLTCAYCGFSITGEAIRRLGKGGKLRENVYYRCANNQPGPDHPRVRWRAADLEQAIIAELESIKISDPELSLWFRSVFKHVKGASEESFKSQKLQLKKRLSELLNQKDRLLVAFLDGGIDEVVFKRKSADLKSEVQRTDEALVALMSREEARDKRLVESLDFALRPAESWRKLSVVTQRKVLDVITLKRELNESRFIARLRKPFDHLALSK